MSCLDSIKSRDCLLEIENIVNSFTESFPALLFVGAFLANRLDYLILLGWLLMSVVINKFLRLFVKIYYNRPLNIDPFLRHGTPSSFLQALWLVTIYKVLYFLYADDIDVPQEQKNYPEVIVRPIVLLTLAISATVLRVLVAAHTWQSVVIGSIIGIGLGAGCFYLTRHLELLEYQKDHESHNKIY